MNKYEIRTNKKKEAILKASLELFQKNGFANTSIKEIAALAKVSQVSIYNYFGSKNLLVKEAIAALMDDMLIMAEEILSLDISFPQKLRRVLSLCPEEFSHSVEEFFTITALEDPQMVQAIFNTFEDRKMLLYEKYIDAGKEAECIDASIPTATILDYVKAFDALGNTPKYLEQAVKYRDDLLKLFISGLLINS
ncbi:MAG TPA: TetR/AcrR family transcriptional regulator [Ruminiclostridium sp.]